jgi:hypothetical protein
MGCKSRTCGLLRVPETVPRVRIPLALPTSPKGREIRLDCSENRGERPQFRSSCFQTGPEKVVLSTPQVRVRASFSGGQTRSPVSTFQQANAMRSQTDDVAKAPLTFIRLRKPPSLITSAFVGTNPENAANFCISRRSGGISAIVSGRLPRKRLLDRVVESPSRAITSV